MDQGGRQRLHTYPGNKASKDDLEFQRSRSNNLKDNGNESPESGSLYSDEIPSGYNSGEQYDTISCGYMSGEAYELPDTRMELREPNLEVIEECIQPLGAAGMAAAADSDDNIFRMPDFNMGKSDSKSKDFFVNSFEFQIRNSYSGWRKWHSHQLRSR